MVRTSNISFRISKKPSLCLIDDLGAIFSSIISFKDLILRKRRPSAQFTHNFFMQSSSYFDINFCFRGYVQGFFWGVGGWGRGVEVAYLPVLRAYL